MRTEDGYIIQQCLDGDSMAFGLLVDKYKRSIYALAFSRVHNFHDAQDIAQEVFIKAYKNLRLLKRWDNFLGWLYRITCNQCNDWIRSGSKRPDHDYIEDQEPSNLDNISLDFYNTDMTYNAIRESLESLPEVYREVLSLRYFGGMNVVEISKLLGISTRTIDRRLNEAMSRLKEEILAMIGTAKEQHELPSAFTFRVVEIIKHIRVNPMSPMKALPFGITLAIGIIGGFLSLGTHLNPTEFTSSFTSSISESKVLDVGEFPVNVLKVSKTPIISNQKMNGDGLGSVVPSLQNALFMAPQANVGEWVRKADMPTARTGSASCVLDGKILTFGGSSKLGALTSVEEYDPATDKWTKKQDMPTPKTWHQVCVVNGKVYIIGDMFDRVSILEYDPLKNTWVKKTVLPTPRMLFSSCVINGMIYVFSGTQGNDAEKPSVEVYDPSKDEWTKKKDMPIAREGASASVVKDKAYIIGGWTPNQTLNTIEEYDPIKDEWKNKSPMPTPRWIHSACVVNDKIYVIGGCIGNIKTHSTVDVYDPSTDTWEELADISVARCFFSAVEVDGRIFIIGGSPIMWDVVPNIEPLSSVEEYDTGFRPSQAIESKGKLPTKWGQIKYNK